jgi:hypothetical protein
MSANVGTGVIVDAGIDSINPHIRQVFQLLLANTSYIEWVFKDSEFDIEKNLASVKLFDRQSGQRKQLVVDLAMPFNILKPPSFMYLRNALCPQVVEVWP